MLEAESELKRLEGVEAAAVVWDGRSISEIHVVSSSSRQPRLISRDVESLLKARGIRVDFKTISVAQVQGRSSPGAFQAPVPIESIEAAEHEASAEASAEARGNGTHGAVSGRSGEGTSPLPHRDRVRGNGLGESAMLQGYGQGWSGHVEPASPPAPTVLMEVEESPRPRFGSVNVVSEGLRVHAQVELLHEGRNVLGTASGPNTRLGGYRLVAVAVLEALKQFLGDDVDFAVEALDFVEVGGTRLVVVAIAGLEGRRQQAYHGVAAVENDPNQAVVAATLHALNRVFGRMHTREETEFELRPTSVEP